MKIPFDIKYRLQIESGEYRVETRNELPVRIICWDRKHGYPIVGLVYDKATGCESYVNANVDGTTSANGKMELSDDLFIVTPEEELTEFENRLCEILDSAINYQIHSTPEETIRDTKKLTPELLSLAREQFIKDGYVIEKKAFHNAVENISDKHMAEMSVEYSTHCKVKDGTRNAIMNWDTFQKVAQKFIDIGKAEAMQDLPRWKKIGRGNNYSSETKFVINGRYMEMNDTLNYVYEVPLSELENLPKED